MADFTDPKVIHIMSQAAALVREADRLGVSLRIERVATQPLAMGHARHVIDAWPARHVCQRPEAAEASPYLDCR